MDLNSLRSPLAFLQSRLPEIPHRNILNSEEAWWKNEGVAISDAIDRAGTPWLRMFDRLGKRVDEILYPVEYQTILKRGYRAGVVWRALEEKSLMPTYLLMYAISYYDPGICCPYTVSLAPLYLSRNMAAPNCRPAFCLNSCEKTILCGRA